MKQNFNKGEIFTNENGSVWNIQARLLPPDVIYRRKAGKKFNWKLKIILN